MMSTTETGRAAEDAAAKYLEASGFRILTRNWRTRRCEIDIIAAKGHVLYFIEVKYRSSEQQGDGLTYITNRKLRQMQFAAEYWVARHQWHGDFRLLASNVAGSGRKVSLVEII